MRNIVNDFRKKADAIPGLRVSKRRNAWKIDFRVTDESPQKSILELRAIEARVRVLRIQAVWLRKQVRQPLASEYSQVISGLDQILAYIDALKLDVEAKQ